jgi:hypothetical protein
MFDPCACLDLIICVDQMEKKRKKLIQMCDWKINKNVNSKILTRKFNACDKYKKRNQI